MTGEDTHQKKHASHNIYDKGATPITKNIIVVDEQGNEYEATYPKRAKGLVKNGRARFVSENKICLACPPSILEDSDMSEEKLTMNYVLEQIEKIASQTEYLNNAIAALSGMKVGEGPDDVAGQEKAIALGDVVRCRETTNQQLLAFYRQMYNDLKPEKPEKPVPPLEESLQYRAMKMVEDIFMNVDMDVELADKLNKILEGIRFIER